MDLRRLRIGDWAMAGGAVALLVVMFLDWFEPAAEGVFEDRATGATAYAPTAGGLSAWESFAVNDLILAVAAGTALAAFAMTALQPTAAVPLALGSLATLIAFVGLALVALRLAWPPDVGTGPEIETGRVAGAWLGLLATALLAGGGLASIRDERMPRPERPAEPRLVNP